MYGTQTNTATATNSGMFENDVKMYGTQTLKCYKRNGEGLRMM